MEEKLVIVLFVKDASRNVSINWKRIFRNMVNFNELSYWHRNTRDNKNKSVTTLSKHTESLGRPTRIFQAKT